jgi:hypothetical protein
MVIYAILAKFELLTFTIFRRFFNFGSVKTDYDYDYCLDTSNKELKLNDYTIPNIKSNINNLDWLLLAHRLYKVTNSLNLVELQEPNLQLNKARGNNLALHIHLLTNYRKLLAVILFIDVKNKFNLQRVCTESFSLNESKYYLQAKNTNLYTPSTFLINPNFFNNMSFFNKKTLVNLLEQNVNLNKQNK